LLQLNSFIKTIDFSKSEQDINKSKKDKKGKNKDYEYMPEKYDDCKDRFGIIFYDDLTVSKPLYNIFSNM
jgi:hypothetical protein